MDKKYDKRQKYAFYRIVKFLFIYGAPMLIKATTLINCKAQNLDGNISKIKDIYFDDRSWRISNLILDMSKWLNNHSRYLIGPNDIEGMDSTNSIIFTTMTLERMQTNSSSKLDLEISNKRKLQKKQPKTNSIAGDKPNYSYNLESRKIITNLQSTKELFGYHVTSPGEKTGWLKDLTADNESWMFKHLIISMKHFSKGQTIKVPTYSVRDINMLKKQINIDLSLDTIQSENEIEAASELSRD